MMNMKPFQVNHTQRLLGDTSKTLSAFLLFSGGLKKQKETTCTFNSTQLFTKISRHLLSQQKSQLSVPFIQVPPPAQLVDETDKIDVPVQKFRYISSNHPNKSQVDVLKVSSLIVY